MSKGILVDGEIAKWVKALAVKASWLKSSEFDPQNAPIEVK